MGWPVSFISNKNVFKKMNSLIYNLPPSPSHIIRKEQVKILTISAIAAVPEIETGKMASTISVSV
jgi:hypothetical protein